jgi:hypothetical protein
VTRMLFVLLGALLLGGAGPHAVPRASLPLPPPLPANPPTDLAAPVPDQDSPLSDRVPQEPRTAWDLRLYRMQDLSTGEGYIPGSAYQAPEQRRPMQTPGFMVTVPLQ